MVDKVIDNVYLVNAPAGSGKTTKIKSMILDHAIEHPNDNILCITFTNRAAEEIGKGLKTDRVYFGTIHSFLHGFLKPYFSHPDIIRLYFKVYREEIQKRIDNIEGKENITESNEKFRDKFGELSFETVQENIRKIEYNETPFNSLYYGGLSHDDLISFSEKVFATFPVIRKRLTQKYQVIFIDEYQDSSAHVLRVFYDAVNGSSSKLYFLGDKMQQIYKNYNGSFEKEFSELNRMIVLDTNHRSIPKIVDILNKIYNDNSYRQKPSPKNIDIEADFDPKVVICDNVSEALESEGSSYYRALRLFLFNQKRFDFIRAGNLYRQLRRMDRYSFVQQYSAVDILTDNTNENPDPLIKLLFIISQIAECYTTSSFGTIIQLLRKNPRIFDKGVYSITRHEDKERLSNLLKSILKRYEGHDEEYTIDAIIDILRETGLVKKEYIEVITDDGEYADVLEVEIMEFRNVADYLREPNISTQHGVKGESHDTVFFIAEDSARTPVVHMYKFLELWSSTDISLSSFELFYYEYMKWIDETNESLGFKLSSINLGLHRQHESYLTSRVSELCAHFSGNIYFEQLCKQDHMDYLSKPNVGKAKACFKENQVYGPLSAYRLFYVGCSRARRNLIIFVDKSKIEGFANKLKEKLRITGFYVEC